ncbi:MAG: sensor histidine kinase, partial [Candidatus Promineifilaceae bacterium]
MARAAICLLITLSVFACADSRVQNAPHARNGRIDFSAWNFETDGIAELSGQWEFYWNRLLTPADFRTGDFPEKIQYITVPTAWGDAGVDGERLQAYGFATYRLLVKTKEAAGRKAMRLSKILSAYNLWVDSRLVASSGIVGKSLAAEKPKLSLALPPFEQDRDTLEIVLQVSNHNYRGGGVATPIYFGSADGIRDYQNRRWAWSLIILTGLLTMGGYHFILYLMRRDDGSPLYLGLYCLCWAANNLFSSPSGWLIGHFFPQIPWPVLYRVGISAYFLSLPALMMFLYSLYPRECSVFAVRFYQALGLSFCASAVFLPVRWVVETVPVYHIFSFALIVYSIAFLIKASVRKRNDALVILAGYLVLTLAASNDMLHDSGLISTTYLFHFGLLLFIVFQAFALSLRFSRAFATAEDLTAELQEKNIALARLDRLKDDFLANTTHELRTPLSGIIGIAESMLAGAAGNLPATARNNLAMVVASGRRLAGLVNDLLDFSRLKHKDLTLNKTAVDLRTLADTVTAFLRPLADAKGITLVQAIPHQIPPVQGDEDRLQQIFHNLIGNAIKFTERGSITVSAAAGNPHVEVAITDTGIGIAPDKHETIFLSFEQADATAARKAGGTGLGLAITRHLVELHGGALWVESTPGQGSTFHFTLTAAETEAQPSPPLLNKIIDDLHAYDGPKLFTNVAHGDCGVKQSGYTV